MAQGAHETELYLFGSHSGKRLLDSDVLFHTLPPQEPAAKNEIPCHRNFIYFCGAVQALELDFLPISWQPQSGLIGRGGTSEIHQLLLSLETSLAFKAIDVGDISRTRTAEDLENIYSLLLTEVQHMGRKSILSSPYIHKVEGVCWSLNKRTGVVDPVLVYEKTRHGDMYRFMTSGQGKSLDISGRIKMCRDVAIGLETLHACSRFFIAPECVLSILTIKSDIIHGDVKPQNVLLMDFEDGSIVPQVADFGYSTIYTSSDPTITVSRTIPWHAPEVGERTNRFLHLDAIRTDIFSFGMLCLWVLFRDEFANQFGTTLDFADDRKPLESNPGSLFKTITILKHQDRLRHFCQNLIQSLSLEPSQKENLTKVFELTLSPHPMIRTSSFQLLRRCLNSCVTNQPSNQTEPVVSVIPENAAQGQHYDFEVLAAPTDY
jgi:serine/threonine protein kinase